MRASRTSEAARERPAHQSENRGAPRVSRDGVAPRTNGEGWRGPGPLQPNGARARPPISLVALLAGLLALAGHPDVGGAHAALVSSVPAARATLSASPPRITLTFNERLEPAYARVSVWDAAGAQVDLKDAALDRDNPKVLGVSLPPLAQGRYTVRYRVLSVDGHVVEASFGFSVGPGRRP